MPKRKPFILTPKFLFVGTVALAVLYLILLGAAPLNAPPDYGKDSSAPGGDTPVARGTASAGRQETHAAVAGAASIGPPGPHTVTNAQHGLLQQTIYMHGERLNFVIRQASHLGLIKGHVWRETASYALLKDAVLHAQRINPNERPLVLDVGSNHGLFAIFAARLGADVIAIEPQRELADVVAHSATTLNGNDVAERIRVYNYAVLNSREFVSLTGSEEGEGAAATVVRAKDDDKRPGMVEARPISDFVPADELRQIAFLKIDVEGFELHAIPSAYALFESKRVRNVLVEFGPPKRWKVASNTAADGIKILADGHEKFGFDVRLVYSEVWDELLAKYMQARRYRQKAAALKDRIIALDTVQRREELLLTMEECADDRHLPCEGYVWFTAEAGEPFETFMSDCGLSKQYDKTSVKKRLRRTADGIVSLGCEGAKMGAGGNKGRRT